MAIPWQAGFWESTVTNLYYDGWNLIEEQNEKGQLLARYVHGARIDEIVKRSTDDGDVYYHHDALGSTVALTNNIGTVVERYSYDIYGAPAFSDGSGNASGSSANGNRFLFTGREWLTNAASYDYRNRIYSPSLGRFLQTDPIRFKGRDTNLYRYVGNNSTQYIDPSGLYRGTTFFQYWECQVVIQLSGTTSSGCPCTSASGTGFSEFSIMSATGAAKANAEAAAPEGCTPEFLNPPDCELKTVFNPEKAA
ncbi:MAG: RHS repeat domain-containing protein [Chthoniobacterales bacterium]